MAIFDYIPRSRLANLHKYKYSGVDHSLLSKHVLTPYWNKLVTLFPLWVAPNSITLTGLGMVMINFLTLLYYDPALSCASHHKLDPSQYAYEHLDEFDSPHRLAPRPLFGRFAMGGAVEVRKGDEARCVPNWIYFTFAIGLFIYQSFDAIDGKQARRTGMAGPLGELFDHGCDALNTTLEVVLCASALNLGRSWWMVASEVATIANFYLTTWEERHTGTLYLSAFSGPIEGIMMICGIYVITGFAGPTFWDQGVLSVLRLDHISWVREHFAGANIPLNDAFLSFSAVGLAANVIASSSNVIKARRASNKAILPPLWGLLPFVFSTILNLLWLSGGPSSAKLPGWASAPILSDPDTFLPFICYWGLSFAYNVGLIIVSHVTNAPFPYWAAPTVWSGLGALDANLPRLLGRQPLLQSTPANARLFILFSLLLSFLLYTHFVVSVIHRITSYIGIPCFLVRPKRPSPASILDVKSLKKLAEDEKAAEVALGGYSPADGDNGTAVVGTTGVRTRGKKANGKRA